MDTTSFVEPASHGGISMKTLVSLKDISLTFRDRPGETMKAIHDIALDIHEGEFLVLLGPSGSGKSTFLRILSGLETRAEGKIDFAEGVSFRDMGFVFQQFALFPWRTVFENVALPLISRGVPESRIKTLVRKELKEMHLLEFADHFPHELSGGMKQRVGLARALVAKPKVVLLDEPFSELDSFTAEDLRKEIERLWRERDVTFVMVSHNLDETVELADRVVVFSAVPAKIVATFENKLARPRNLRSHEAYALEDSMRAVLRQRD